MSLDKVSATSLSLIQLLSDHNFGVPKIHNSDDGATSSLTIPERFYLKAYRTLPSKADDDLEHSLVETALNKAYYEKSPSIQDANLVSLINSRDNLSEKLQELSNSVTDLKTQLNTLSSTNEALHRQNAQLVEKITSEFTESQTRQRSLFSEADISKYRSSLNELRDSRRKSFVLNEFIIGLITATGIDWQEDPELEKLVLSCGAHDLEKVNDDVLNLINDGTG